MKIVKPTIYKIRGAAPKKVHVVDLFQKSLNELFFTRNPQAPIDGNKGNTLKRFLPHGGVYSRRSNTHLIIKLTPGKNLKIDALDKLVSEKWQLTRVEPGKFAL